MKGKIYVCDDCGCRSEFTSYVKARAAGWAIAKDYRKCYCPRCAPFRRFGGATAKNYVPTESGNGEQLKIDNIG